MATQPVTLDAEAEEALYRRLAEQAVEALWKSDGPRRPRLVPHVWRWSDLHPLLLESARVPLGADVERRALRLINPAGRGDGATRTLTAALQVILPGEVAPTHRHTPAALRWIIEGEGAYTVVEGERVAMRVGDLLLTPQSLWHDHAHEGQGPMIWLDGLDAPLVAALDAWLFERFPGGGLQPVRQQRDAGRARYGGAGLLPAGRGAAGRYSPLMRYPFDEAHAALRRLAELERDQAATPAAVCLEYVDPTTGGHVMPTVACFLHLLPPGAATPSRRRLSSSVYHVVQGSGVLRTDAGETPWSERDTLAVPSWTWCALANASSSQDVVLFQFTDLPVYEGLGLEREETR